MKKEQDHIKNSELPSKRTIEPEEIPKVDFVKDNLYEITYYSSKEERTVRKINILSIEYKEEESAFYLKTYCYKAESHRTFVSSRIESITDLKTGEIVGDVMLYLCGLYVNSPKGIFEEIITNYQQELNILFFLSTASGRSTKKKRELIFDFVINISNVKLEFNDFEKETIQIDVNQQIFRNELKEMKLKENSSKINLVKYAELIVNSSKKKDPIEDGTLILIKNELGIS
jgi:hypothetical protein